jgi:hypothetical protein
MNEVYIQLLPKDHRKRDCLFCSGHATHLACSVGSVIVEIRHCREGACKTRAVLMALDWARGPNQK